MPSLLNFVVSCLGRERTIKETTRKQNKKQITRIKIERLYLHHYCAIASHVDIPILEVKMKFVSMDKDNRLSLPRVSNSSVVQHLKYFSEGHRFDSKLFFL